VSLLPKMFLDCVVAIGVDRQEIEQGSPGWIATGFFYGRLLGENAEGQKEYSVYLVSNRHVFEGLENVVIRANPAADDPAPARDYLLSLTGSDGENTWIAHPEEGVDVAVVKVDYNRIQTEGMEVSFFVEDVTAFTAKQISEAGVTEGDFVYVLGYPMALVGDHRAVVVVRNGSLARIRDALARPVETYLVDSTVFPGNSGGPVVTRPEPIALEGTTPQRRAALIGIVTAYVPYREIAVSAQTQNVRMIFEENSGLAAAHLVDTIDDCIDADPLFAQMRVERAALAPAMEESPVAE
jgi:hypothetical protein